MDSGSNEEARKKEVLVWSSTSQDLKLKAGETTALTTLLVHIDPNIPLTGFQGNDL